MPSGARTRQSYSDRSFLVLQCCAEGCEKWRRVDSATYNLFWNDWMNAHRQERRQVLLDHAPHFCSKVHAMLRELAAQHFKPRPRARKPRPEFRITLDVFRSFLSERRQEDVYATYPRAVFEVFLDEAQQFVESEFARAYTLDGASLDPTVFDQKIL